jgi:replicative DNA helicase
MDKLLPNNIEAECGVLGSIIIDPEAIVQVADFLRPDDFYRDSHRIIFEVVERCYEQGEPADFITICDELERRQKLEYIGGASYITSLINNVPTSGNVEYYGRIVERTSILRRLIWTASRISALAYKEEVTTDEAIQESQALVYDIAQRRKVDRLTSHREGLSQYMETLSDLCDRHDEGVSKLTGIPTGFGKLDTMTGGLQRGDLVVLAARPSVGKSSLALNIAKSVIGAGYNALFFSLEMSREQLWQRLLAESTGIDQARLRIGNIHHELIQMGTARYDGEWPLIAERVGELVGTSGTLFVDDSTGLTPLDMRTRAQKVQAQNGLDLIIVDYLQLAKATRGSKNGGYENRVQEISSITKDLKALARDLNVPVLALAQLSRAAEGIEPQLHHLKESGSIEEDSDVVGLMWLTDAAQTIRLTPREDAQEGHTYPVECKIAKQRKGPVGPVPLRFVPWVTRFEER